MPALAPTVYERLARCGTKVRVGGIVPGAHVVLSVAGNEFHANPTAGGFTFDVPGLSPGDEVRARQDDGAGFTPWSASVFVEDVQLPPVSSPQLPVEVGTCSQCVRITGLVPGCEVETLIGTEVVGHGIADRNGNICLGLKAHEIRRVELCARMIVCGQNSPTACTPFVEDESLNAPELGAPIYGCQRIVPLLQLHRGARSRIETRDPGDASTQHGLGSICNCWNNVNVRVHEDLRTNWQVRAQQYWNSDLCQTNGPWSAWHPIIEPDEGIKPTVLPLLIEGDQLIRVQNQILGGALMIHIREGESGPITDYGPRPADDVLEISLNEPLKAGQFVAVTQTLCGRSEQSDWQEVLPGPAVVYPPFVQEPLVDCARSVQVSGVHPGASVRVFADGFPIGIAWAGDQSSISVPTMTLVQGQKITARQWVGGQASGDSNVVEVLSVSAVHRPRILQPVAIDDTRVWVSGVTPGCTVSIRSNGQLLGETNASESIVEVPVLPVPNSVQAEARLCELTSTSEVVHLVTNPGKKGLFTPKEKSKDYGSFNVPSRSVNTPHQSSPDGNFPHPIIGQLYFPADDKGELLEQENPWPVVIIAHGYQISFFEDELQSYLGYGWLARHLASWGIVVFSVNLTEVNAQTDISPFQQSARGDIVLKCIDELMADSELRGKIDRNKVGLVGHSMGGEGVVVAQALNLARSNPYGIQGVVSIAPTQYRPDIELKDTRYLQLIGSLDLLLNSLDFVTGDGTGDNPRFGCWRIYDRAVRPKTHLWIYRARHDGFNPNWWNSGGLSPEPASPDELSLAEHASIGRAMINAFFRDAFGDSRYAGYMTGPVRPRGLYQFDIYPQHHATNPKVIDDFGDAANVLDKNTNVVGQNISVTGAQVSLWEDVAHTTLNHSVHDTNSVDFEWIGPDANYGSPLGGVTFAGDQSLSFRVSQFYNEDTNGDPLPVTNPIGASTDIFVELRAGSQTARLRSGLIGEIPYPYPTSAPLSVMRTINLPIDAFAAMLLGGGNITNATTIQIRFAARPTGRVLVDDLEFTS